MAGKFQTGQLPDEDDIRALEEAEATWVKDVGSKEKEDAQLRRFREDSERALALQFAAYRGGAKAAFDSMIASTSAAAKRAGNASPRCSG